jgi:AbrB family looped-hinge helix DNA binding protein
MVRAKITHGYRIALPQSICRKLGLSIGDEVELSLCTDEIIIRRDGKPVEGPFGEWSNAEDREAYRDL